MKRFAIFAAAAVTVLVMICVAGTANAAVQGIKFSVHADDPLADMPASRLSTENVPREELAATSKEVLAYLRNRIYANHGYVFQSKKWKDEFSRFDWYKPNPSFSYGLFNAYEKENMRRILAAEKGK